MGAQGNACRVRPLLLILLWIWVITVAILVDMFWNVDEFDGFRPRASLYRGMRVAAHLMVGEPVEEDGYQGHSRRDRLTAQTRTLEDVPAMVSFCQQADYSDVTALKNMALTARDPLAAGNAIGALGRLRKVAHDPELVALLRDERRRVRRETVVALGKGGEDSSIKDLEPLLGDNDAIVRLLAIRAIGEIGGQRATEVLRGVTGRPGATQNERLFAQAALQ